jgi:hypothetical protein
MEGTPLSNACDWLAENPTESVVAASRIFGVPESTIQTSITQLAQPQCPQRGGQNKVLTIMQVEVLKQWIIR